MTTLHPPTDKKYIFLDTCIFQYAGDKHPNKAKAVQDCLDSLIQEGYTLVLSDISVFENLQGLSGGAYDKARSLLEVYERKNVSTLILLLAARLGGFYHDEKMDGVDMGDKIIAATAILGNGHILTANHKDYPHPFFVTKRSIPLSYKIKHIHRHSI